MSVARSSLLALALTISLAASAQSVPPGSPKPSTGAPGDKPGRSDPFGTQGEKAEEKKSQAQAVAEHKQPTISKIEIEGNQHTRSAEVKRHLALKEGDELDNDKIFISRIRLLQFGAFDEVDAQVVKGEDQQHVVLHIKVHERNTLFVTDAIYGSTVSTKHYGVLGLADANFVGVGLGLAAQALLGTDAQHAFRLSLYEPDFQVGGISFVAGLEGLQLQGRENACGSPSCWTLQQQLRYTRAGGEVDVGVRGSTYERFVFGYRYEQIDARVANAANQAYAGPYVLIGRSRLSAITGSFDRDARDDTFLPTHGSRVQFSVALGSRSLGGSYDYSRYLLQLEKWFPLPRGMAIRVDATGGIVQGNAPFFERFYAADWAYYSLGVAVARVLDMNMSPDPRYDTVLGLAGIEYDYPLWKKPNFFVRRAYLALGGRATWSEAAPRAGRTTMSRSPFSFDASLRLDTKVGLLSISAAYLTDLLF